MKKVISIVLIWSMILLSAVTVFSIDFDTPSYDLNELFKDYHEYSLPEMVEFIDANPTAYGIVECIRGAFGFGDNMIFVHMAGDLNSSGRFPNLEAVGISNENSSKYLVSTARIVKPDMSGKILMGEVGNKEMSVEINREFIEYINSLDSATGNRVIINFLMNIISNEEAVGISWFRDNGTYGDGIANDSFVIGDCNSDGAVNGTDGYLIKRAILGYDDGIDPIAVDMNSDGRINGKDALDLKKKVVIV